MFHAIFVYMVTYTGPTTHMKRLHKERIGNALINRKYEIILIILMKNFLLAILLIAIYSSVNAQDVITLKDNTTINVKVLEIGETHVKYKKWDNLEGPTYNTNISNIISVTYQNGSRDVFSNYQTPKSDIAQSIDNAGEKVSKGVISSGNNIARGIDNSVFIQQQKLYGQAKGLRVAAYASILIFTGGSIALGVVTDMIWLGAVGPFIGVAIATPCLISANRKESTASSLVMADIYKHSINDKFSVGLTAMSNNRSNVYCMGPSLSVRF